MSDPTTVNKTASVVNDILKSLIEGQGVAVVEAEALAVQPWLGLPLIRQVFEMILNWIAGQLYAQAAMVATKLIIDAQVNSEASKASAAFQNLQMAIASGDKNAIETASNQLDQAYGALIHSDGSSSP